MPKVFFFLLLLLHGCSCGNGSNGAMRIGIDADWYPLNFGPQTSYVNGYTEDLLVEMSRYTGIEFEKIPANWDSLVDGLRERKYDAILTSMPPYVFNTAKYDFSSNYLDLGPVLIVPTNAETTELDKMHGQLVGIIGGDPSVAVLEKHPAIIIRNYSSIPDLLDAVANGAIQAAILDRIPAVNFTNDLYAGRLKIGSGPLTDKGLHLVTLKGHERIITDFDKTIVAFKRKKTLEDLLKKWQLE
jgi:polar amino acid transport system substrate-binding protein